MKAFKLFNLNTLLTVILMASVGSIFGQTVVNGRLAFRDQASFIATYNQLSAAEDAYVDTRPETPDGQQFEPSPTLANFESSLRGFTSLRKLDLDNESAQLNTGIAPDQLRDFTWVSDDVAATLLNGNYMVQIADTIYYLYSKNITLKIPAANEFILAALLRGEPFSKYSRYFVVDERGGPTGEDPCVADFNFGLSFLTSFSGTFTFTGSGVKPNTTYLWEFGDGTPNSTEKNPTHTYTASGLYNVCLTIETKDSLNPCYSRKCRLVPVNNGCFAEFKYDKSGSPGGICFTDQSGTINGTIITRVWSFGDGSPDVTNVTNPCHTYACDKSYSVTLKITTSTGCTFEANHTVEVSSHGCCDKDIDENETRFTVVLEPNVREIRGNCEDFYFLFGLWSNVNAELRHYRKGFLNKWWQKPANLKVEIRGNVYTKDQNDCVCKNAYNIDCEDSGTSTSKVKAKKHIPVKFRTFKDDPWRANFYEGGVLRKTVIAPVTCQ